MAKIGRPGKSEKMSQENATVTEAQTATAEQNPNEVAYTVRKKVFDFEKFERRSVESKGTFTKAKDLVEALERSNKDQSILLSYANDGLLKAAKKAEKAKIATSGGSVKYVNNFVNSFRLMPMFTKDSDGKVYGDGDRAKQTKAIYAWIQSTPLILDQVKAGAIAALEAELEKDSEENEETEGA